MQNVQIQEVSSHKHLGLYFSSDCSWHQDIDQAILKNMFVCRASTHSCQFG